MDLPWEVLHRCEPGVRLIHWTRPKGRKPKVMIWSKSASLPAFNRDKGQERLFLPALLGEISIGCAPWPGAAISRFAARAPCGEPVKPEGLLAAPYSLSIDVPLETGGQ